MTLASIETPSRTASSAKLEPSEPSPSPSTRAENSEFGQIMSGVLQTRADAAPAAAAGQEMAASADAAGTQLENLSAPLGCDALMAVHLGPHLNVITAQAPAPDEQSLEAFARSQGLDETAVQWLLGSSQAPQVNPAVAALSVTASPSLPATALEGTLSSAPTGPLGVFSTGQTASTPPTGSEQAQSAPADADMLTPAMNAAALWSMSQATEKTRVSAPPQETPNDLSKVQINLMASPAPAAFWLLRNPQATTPAKEVLSTPSGMALSDIDLSQVATPELLESLNLPVTADGPVNSFATSEHHAPVSGHPGHRVDMATAARQESQNPDVNASAPDASMSQRSENVQNLAEKMGQAVGQRILSEIEKGQWHLKLSLRPATLGHIEVEMRMRSGELDAVFTAPQTLTRELLQEGMGKLKDTLNQMGMDVASMQVGDGQTRQGGGESTPGKMPKSTKSNTPTQGPALSAVQAPAPQMKMGQDGWDVLV